MKKILTWLMVMAMLVSLGGVYALAEEEEDVMWGSYTLIEMTGDSGMSEEEAAMLEAFYSLITMEIEEDGHATLDFMGEIQEGQFDFEAGTFSDEDGIEVPYVYEDGKITFGDDELTMTFQKGEGGLVGARTFDYFELESLTDEGGEPLDLEDMNGTLILFADGIGILTLNDESVELKFDFDAKTIYDLDGDEGTFTLEDGVLTITDEIGVVGTFRQADPGFVGSYAVLRMGEEGEEGAEEAMAMLAAMDMLPTLTIDEDGHGIMTMFGEDIEMDFDFDSMIVSVTEEDGESETPFTYENGRILIESEGTVLEFARVMDDVPAAAEAE